MSFHLVDAAHDLPIKKGDKQVLIALARYADHDGSNARPGMERLRASTSASETFVKDHLKGLVSLGLIRHVGGGLGRGNAVEYEIDAKRVYARALDSGWKDTRQVKGRETTPSSQVKGRETVNKGRSTPTKGSGDDPHSVLGHDSVSGDSVDDDEISSIAAQNGHDDEERTMAHLHPQHDHETTAKYVIRLSRLYQEEALAAKLDKASETRETEQ